MHANNNIVRSGRNSFSLLLLFLCTMLAGSCTTDGERRYWADVIAEADSMNRNYVPMTSDSLLIDACEFYDRHGSPNERMKAHYLLGCVYRDMGEAPRAIESYQDAVACADTTDSDCDFQKLGCIYSQMGDVYYSQLLLSDSKEARKRAVYYAKMSRDTLGMLSDMKRIAGTYILLNKKDSAENILNTTTTLFQKYGKEQDALEASLVQMYLLCDQKERVGELQKLINNYDLRSNRFDKQHELPPFKRMFYYYKGKYYEMVDMLDSAEFYYRKIFYEQMPVTMLNSMYKGLLNVYKERNISDSIAKYAKLYCEINDSSIAKKDQDLTARLAASYRFNSIQREALVHEQAANYARIQLVVVIAIIILLSIVSFFYWFQYKKKKEHELEQMNSKYVESADIYHRNLEALRIIDDSRKSTIAELQQKLVSVEEELHCENDQLKNAIKHLEKEKNLKKTVEYAHDYFNLPIIQQICKENNPLKKLNEVEKENLLKTTNEYYPNLVCDLKDAGISSQGILVCILIVLQIKPSQISNLLGCSSQVVTNLKRQIGETMGDKSARTLYKNLIRKYGIYIS